MSEIRKITGPVSYVAADSITLGMVEIATDEEVSINNQDIIISTTGAPVVATAQQMKDILIANNNVDTKYVEIFSFDGLSTYRTITHNLNSQDLLICLWDWNSKTLITDKSVTIIDSNNIAMTEVGVITYKIVIKK